MDYDTFCKNKSAWQEPENYSFTYEYAVGSSFAPRLVKVIVKNGEASFEFYEEKSEELKEFSSITEVFDFFHDKYLSEKNTENLNYEITYKVEYSKTDSGKVYPSILKERMIHISDSDLIGGYGGIYIKIKTMEIQ